MIQNLFKVQIHINYKRTLCHIVNMPTVAQKRKFGTEIYEEINSIVLNN